VEEKADAVGYLEMKKIREKLIAERRERNSWLKRGEGPILNKKVSPAGSFGVMGFMISLQRVGLLGPFYSGS